MSKKKQTDGIGRKISRCGIAAAKSVCISSCARNGIAAAAWLGENRRNGISEGRKSSARKRLSAISAWRSGRRRQAASAYDNNDNGIARAKYSVIAAAMKMKIRKAKKLKASRRNENEMKMAGVMAKKAANNRSQRKEKNWRKKIENNRRAA